VPVSFDRPPLLDVRGKGTLVDSIRPSCGKKKEKSQFRISPFEKGLKIIGPLRGVEKRTRSCRPWPGTSGRKKKKSSGIPRGKKGSERKKKKYCPTDNEKGMRKIQVRQRVSSDSSLKGGKRKKEVPGIRGEGGKNLVDVLDGQGIHRRYASISEQTSREGKAVVG